MSSPSPQPLSPQSLPLPLATQAVAAGFPSPAEDHAVERIDLMAQIVRHPQATFFLRIRGDSMREAGILDGSVVVVDRALRPRHGQTVEIWGVVVACIQQFPVHP